MNAQRPQGKVSWSGVAILVSFVVAAAVIATLVGNGVDAVTTGVANAIFVNWGPGALLVFVVLCIVSWIALERNDRKNKKKAK